MEGAFAVERDMDHSSRQRRWPYALLAAMFLLLGARSAHADKVDTLIKRMLNSSDYKQRLSAALNLQKTGDKRAIPAYIEALSDSDKTVRGVAAASLGKLVNSNTSAKVRKRALAALKKVSARDSNAFVKKQAQKAYNAVKNLGSGGAVAGATIYVNIGTMSDSTNTGKKMTKMMRDITLKTFRKKAPGMATAWPGGKKPSKKQLKKAGTAGYYVDGTLTKVDVDQNGSSSLVGCNVSMLIASYPDKSMFGFLKGSAKVQAGSSDTDIGYAKEDCVGAVVEDLVRRKIIPTIKQRSP
jgi:hypothetical protein